jgi:hypothetical protein
VTVTRTELVAGVALLLITAVAAVRIAMVDRPPLRPLSVEGIAIPGEAIASGQTLVREAQWRAPADVYVMGWSYSLGAPAVVSDVVLKHGETVLFVGPHGQSPAQNPGLLPAGTGYRLPANDVLTLRLTIVNTGPPGQTSGSRVLVYFVPVAGN